MRCCSWNKILESFVLDKRVSGWISLQFEHNWFIGLLWDVIRVRRSSIPSGSDLIWGLLNIEHTTSLPVSVWDRWNCLCLLLVDTKNIHLLLTFVILKYYTKFNKKKNKISPNSGELVSNTDVKDKIKPNFAQ